MYTLFSKSKEIRTIILSFKKAVVYILSTKKKDIRKWRQVEFKKGL